MYSSSVHLVKLVQRHNICAHLQLSYLDSVFLWELGLFVLLLQTLFLLLIFLPFYRHLGNKQGSIPTSVTRGYHHLLHSNYLCVFSYGTLPCLLQLTALELLEAS